MLLLNDMEKWVAHQEDPRVNKQTAISSALLSSHGDVRPEHTYTYGDLYTQQPLLIELNHEIIFLKSAQSRDSNIWFLDTKKSSNPFDETLLEKMVS